MWWNLLRREKHTLCHGYRLGESTGRVQIGQRTCNRLGSLKVPLEMSRVPGLLSMVQETVVPHRGQNTMRSQTWLSSERCS